MGRKTNAPESEDELRPEYDFSKMKLVGRGIYAERYRSGTNLVLLEPDVRKAFPDDESINEALRLVIANAIRINASAGRGKAARSKDPLIVRRSSLLKPQPTRRKGIKERRLLDGEDSPHQNIAIMDADQDAEVEIHQIATSESIFVLRGVFEVILPNSVETVKAGDVCYFPPKSVHGLRCTRGPGQFLVIFAPPGNSDG